MFKTKFIAFFIIIFLSIFGGQFFFKNIYIKVNNDVLVTYFGDTERETNFQKIIKKDLEKKYNQIIKVKIGKDFVLEESLKTLGYKITPLYNSNLIWNFNFIKDLNINKKQYSINIKYKLEPNTEQIKQYLASKMKNQTFIGKYYIMGYLLDPFYGLIGIEDETINYFFEGNNNNNNNNNNNFGLLIKLKNIKTKIISSQEFRNLELKITAINQTDKFEEKYQSLLLNGDYGLEIKKGDNTIFEQKASYKDIYQELRISNRGTLIQYKTSFYIKLLKQLKAKINLNLDLEDWTYILKPVSYISGKYNLIVKKKTFIDYEKIIRELKNKWINDQLFKKYTYEINKDTTSITQIKFSNKKTYIFKLQPETGIETKNKIGEVCSIFNGLKTGDSIIKRYNYILTKGNSKIKENELDKLTDLELLNAENQIGMYLSKLKEIGIELKNDNLGINYSSNFNGDFKINLFDIQNNLRIGSRDFYSNCQMKSNNIYFDVYFNGKVEI